MQYPIVMYGHSILRKKAQHIDLNRHPFDLKTLVKNMYETMDEANGIGLAAPQINKGIRMFIVGIPQEDEQGIKKFTQTFVNPQMVTKSEVTSEQEEGCLSIPGIVQRVQRPEHIKMTYYDLDGTLHEKVYDGIEARVIQHEYDHIEGVLFVDYLNPFQKRLLNKKLRDISKGEVDTDYPILIPNRKK